MQLLELAISSSIFQCTFALDANSLDSNQIVSGKAKMFLYGLYCSEMIFLKFGSSNLKFSSYYSLKT